MIKTILAVDNADIVLGDFFSYCANMIKQIFSGKFEVSEFTSNKISNDISINIHLEQIKSAFIFIALTHGSVSELTCFDFLPYISVGKNTCFFRNSLSFCFSCGAGKLLGKEIVDLGGKCFVGHNNTIYASKYTWKKLFSKPIICFWVNFVLGKTVFACINAKRVEYTRLIDEIYETDVFHAIYLLENRDSLIVYRIER
ncbi:MAG: hypothetical protein LBJ31_03165 [Treponema sp.]|jgi:hypothetical protein|nr:hypothetical protein [Treponema sp.]